MIRKAFRDKPWLWVVVALALFVGINVCFVIIAFLNAPVPVD